MSRRYAGKRCCLQVFVADCGEGILARVWAAKRERGEARALKGNSSLDARLGERTRLDEVEVQLAERSLPSLIRKLNTPLSEHENEQ